MIRLPVLFVLASLALLGGCGEESLSPDARMQATDAAGGFAPGAEPMRSLEKMAPAAVFSGAPTSTADSDQVRHIAETQHWTYHLPVEDIERVWSAHAQACAAGCEIVSASISGRSQGFASGRLEMRVERALFVPLEQSLLRSGAPLERTIQKEDRTLQVVDVEARIENQRQLVQRLRAMLAGRPEAELKDVLALERELVRAQSELDSMQSRRRMLANETEKVHLHLNYQARPHVDPGSIWAPLEQAWYGMGGQFARSLAGVLLFIATALPWLVIALPALWIFWKGISAARRALSGLLGRIRAARKGDES